MENEKLNESILDPVQATRCDAMFNPNDKSEQPVLLKSTKDFILGLLEKFRQEVKLKFEYTQAFIVGSSLGFQYKDTSDIDVDVRVDIPREKLKGKFHCIPKNINLPGTSHPINVYLMTSDDPEFDFDTNAENAYDLLTDTWIKQGRLENSDPIPYEHVAGISEFLIDGMALELSRAERDMYETKKYLSIDTSKSQITDKELKEAIDRSIGRLLVDKDALRLAHSVVLRLERGGFEWNMPFEVSIKYKYQDKHYSMNNLIYKYIDQFGYYERLDDMAKEIDAVIKKAKERLIEVKNPSTEDMNNAEAAKEVAQVIGDASATYNEKVAAQQEQNQKESDEEEVTKEDIINMIVDGELDDDEIQQLIDEGEITEDEVNTALDSIEGEDVENISESLTDSQIVKILVENRYEGTRENISKIRNGSYVIYAFDVYQDLNENLSNRTERKVNYSIQKRNGRINMLVNAGFGFLFGGPLGGIFALLVDGASKSSHDEKERQLYDAVRNDSDCEEILDKIKNELHSDTPNKGKVKMYRKQFELAVKEVKRQTDKEAREYDNPSKQHISL